LKRIFRDLFIREGFQFDYVFDWTILKYQQSQASGTPLRPIGPGVVGDSYGQTRAVANQDKRQPGGEGRVMNSFHNRRTSTPPANTGDLSRQKSPVEHESSRVMKEAMVSGSSYINRPSGSARRPVGISSSRDTSAMANEATDLSSRILHSTEVRSGSFFRNKVSGGLQSGSPHKSSDKRLSASARHSSAAKNYESSYRGLESLTLGWK